ncbi:beta-1,3-galactosyltransferase 5-like [Lineus longissimus]|uniref:beta-1,3-galactosyltransferase 5-like n=1 Tax=Lineus longissimus TaxID=88925 RepID=UPI00315D550E
MGNLATMSEAKADDVYVKSIAVAYDGILSPPSCEYDKPYLLLVVLSSTRNFERRMTIRDTIGKIRQHRGRNIRLAFMTMRTNIPVIEKKLQSESTAYRDIIQAKFNEAYRNLTLKTLESFKWTIMKCPSAKFMFKVDDDVIFFSRNIVDYSLKLESENRTFVYEGDFAKKYGPSLPSRDPKHKWYISEQDFNNKTFPGYILGYAVLFSRDTVHALYRASFHVPRVFGTPRHRFPIEDVFTGVCAKYSHITPRQSPQIHLNVSKFEGKTKNDQCAVLQELAVHGIGQAKMKQLFDESEHQRTNGICFLGNALSSAM